MQILIAADKFKDSLSAEAVCTAIAEAIHTVQPEAHLLVCPLSDGGDGFAPVLTTAANGVLAGESVTDPLGRPTQAAFGIIAAADIPAAALERLHLPTAALDAPKTHPTHRDDHQPHPRADDSGDHAAPPATALPHQLHHSADAQEACIAVVEMASASGLQLLETAERDPWQTDTTGTGELIAAAQRAGVAAILLGVGGSATNDLGLGALSALGYRFLDAQGNPVPRPCPANWHRIHRIEGALPKGLPPLRIACDVTNPLLGPRGAAAVYGPQKGLHAKDLPQLEHEAERIGRLLCEHHGRDFNALSHQAGAGAAGGIAFGLLCAVGEAGAQLIAGFDLVADWLQLHQHLRSADLVITGEGRFDTSSLAGKGPGALARTALERGKPVHVFAGSIDCQPAHGLHLHAISPADMPLPQALARADALLRAAVAEVFSTGR